MRIMVRNTLREFSRRHPDAKGALDQWFSEVRAARWYNPAEVKAHFRTASVLGGERIVFNICGNKYRLVTSVNFVVGVVYIKFIGTHGEYDKIDARTVQWNPRS